MKFAAGIVVGLGAAFALHMHDIKKQDKRHAEVVASWKASRE